MRLGLMSQGVAHVHCVREHRRCLEHESTLAPLPATRRVVLDEAQCIKNPRTLAAHAAWTLKVNH